MKNKSVNIIDAIDDDKFLINKSIENAIQIFREDKFVINKLVFDSIELLASAEEAQRELKSKNFKILRFLLIRNCRVFYFNR